MFTGIIQCLGDVVSRRGATREARFSIIPRNAFPDPELGESIAVNGTCLTAEQFNGAAFVAYASGETFSTTTLANLQPGGVVNLERAVSLSTRLGGHLVSGHVDTLCSLSGRREVDSSVELRFTFPAKFARQIIPKGSVAVDGVSLTVNACGGDFFEVNVIPATLAETTLDSWKIGQEINLETDLIGKYVERMLGISSQTAVDETADTDNKNQTNLTLDFFREHGF